MTVIDNAIIRALCVVAYAERNPEWASWHDKRLKWASDIVRQVAEQPMGRLIDGDEQP